MSASNFGLSNHYRQLSVHYDDSHDVLWTYFNQQGVIPSANPIIVDELSRHQNEIAQYRGVLSINNRMHSIKYSVAASLTPNVFNLGGYLPLIKELAINKNRDGLLAYAIKGIDLLATRITRFNNSPIVNITLLQGLALGGGLEGALASDVVIAERKTILGFPEILFNMFPGMGGYSLVSRKAGNKVADEMILKGKQYTAEQAYEMGLVDVLVDDGEGEKAVYDWIARNKPYYNGYLATMRAKNIVNPITYQELLDITHIWVDTALKLTEREFSIMDRFIYSQEKLYLKDASSQQDAIDNILAFKRTAT